ncbi:MAG: hypothetical protein IPL32_18795 [Chloracidobacterium sp.]|nr:hypothetical protein [Chloracidobacterium sp.]
MKIIGRATPKFDVAIASADDVADKWKGQYFTNGKWGTTSFGDSSKVYQQILDAGSDFEAIAKAIGNKGWTHPICMACNNYVTRAIVLPNDCREDCICGPCLTRGLELLDRAA